MSVMKGGAVTDQHAQERESEALYMLETYNVVIDHDLSHSYDRHGAHVTDDYLTQRIRGEQDPAPFATRFLSLDHHMMCRERFLSMHHEAMNDPDQIASKYFSATISFTESIGEGIGPKGFRERDDPMEMLTYSAVFDVTFRFTYDEQHHYWIEITGFPDVKGGNYET